MHVLADRVSSPLALASLSGATAKETNLNINFIKQERGARKVACWRSCGGALPGAARALFRGPFASGRRRSQTLRRDRLSLCHCAHTHILFAQLALPASCATARRRRPSRLLVCVLRRDATRLGERERERERASERDLQRARSLRPPPLFSAAFHEPAIEMNEQRIQFNFL